MERWSHGHTKATWVGWQRQDRKVGWVVGHTMELLTCAWLGADREGHGAACGQECDSLSTGVGPAATSRRA